MGRFPSDVPCISPARRAPYDGTLEPITKALAAWLYMVAMSASEVLGVRIIATGGPALHREVGLMNFHPRSLKGNHHIKNDTTNHSGGATWGLLFAHCNRCQTCQRDESHYPLPMLACCAEQSVVAQPFYSWSCPHIFEPSARLFVVVRRESGCNGVSEGKAQTSADRENREFC
jgi:hypothetical protein